jgi:NAD(P)-dependent dehydrogenase (short-subunit alcohol dehydrogenase family)
VSAASARAGRLSGKTAIVTGSTGRGLGTEIARCFVQEGANVVVTGRRVDEGMTIAEELGPAATFVRADLRDSDECQMLVERSVQVFGGLNILVNNAVSGAMSEDSSVGEVSDEVWERTFAVAVGAVLHLSRHAIPAMVRTGNGSIVNIGSRAALRGTPSLAAYSAAKGALHALTRSMAVDYARFAIRANTVAPGFIVGKERDDGLASERWSWAEGMQLTHPPTTTEVALAALYLASDEAASVTGATLVVDGGGSIARGLTLG